MENKRRGRPRTDSPLVGLSIQLPQDLRDAIAEEAQACSRSIAGQIRHVLQAVYGPAMHKAQLVEEMQTAHPERPLWQHEHIADVLTEMRARNQ